MLESRDLGGAEKNMWCKSLNAGGTGEEMARCIDMGSGVRALRNCCDTVASSRVERSDTT